MYKDGFKPDCWVQTEHGEVLPLENQFDVCYVGSSSIRIHVGNEEGGNLTWKDNLNHDQEMIFDAVGHEFRMYSEPLEKVPNLDDERFYSLLDAVNRPLQEGCMHAQLSLAVIMLSNKLEAN